MIFPTLKSARRRIPARNDKNSARTRLPICNPSPCTASTLNTSRTAVTIPAAAILPFDFKIFFFMLLSIPYLFFPSAAGQRETHSFYFATTTCIMLVMAFPFTSLVAGSPAVKTTRSPFRTSFLLRTRRMEFSIMFAVLVSSFP